MAHTPRFEPDKDAAIVVDGTTGTVLYERNALAARYPASLTKMMTLYLLFDELKKGKLNSGSMITASSHAVAQKPTKLGLASGESINVDLAIKALVVRSANDVAVAIAETLGGTESAFAAMMTREARTLGMDHTTFRNASGLPDPGQQTTAHDLAILGRRLAYDFPQYYHYFSTPSFIYQGRLYETHDNLLGRFDGTDGIKTGYTNASGFNLVSSVVREGKHLIAVVMGGRTAHVRDNEMMQLLAETFVRARQNPSLVAKANAPWQNANALKSGTMVASVSPAATSPPQGGLVLQLPAANGANVTAPASDDEDAAEAATAHSDMVVPAPVATASATSTQPAATTPAAVPFTMPNGGQPPAPAQQTPTQPTVIAAALPMPAPVTTSQLAPTAAAPKPVFKPAVATRQAVVPTPKPRAQTIVASYQPATPPAATAPATTAAPEVEEGDIGGVGVPVQTALHPAEAAGAKHWAVQIGAFTDAASAKTQLSLYAERSMDVLAHAQRTVIPFDSVDGHKLFRARFGPFAENEAREVCRRMTERGQTCFAALVAD